MEGKDATQQRAGRSAHTKIAIANTRHQEETARKNPRIQRPQNPVSNTGSSTRQPRHKEEKEEKSTHAKITEKEHKIRIQDVNINKKRQKDKTNKYYKWNQTSRNLNGQMCQNRVNSMKNVTQEKVDTLKTEKYQ